MPQRRQVFADIPEELASKDSLEISLSPQDSRHLSRVLRLKPGSPLTVTSRITGQLYQGIIIQSNVKDVRVKILRAVSSKPPRSRVRTLAFALSKGAKNDLVCEKACELGAQHIIFWQAARSIVRLEPKKEGAARLRRWLKIAEAAAKQSGQNCIPRVSLLHNCNELLSFLKVNSLPDDVFLCCSLSAMAIPIAEIERPAGLVHLVVGPEGDLTAEEEKAFVEHGFRLVSLGSFVLRSETAAIAALGLAQGLWGNVKP